jgi:hypothetical protein
MRAIHKRTIHQRALNEEVINRMVIDTSALRPAVLSPNTSLDTGLETKGERDILLQGYTSSLQVDINGLQMTNYE